MWGRRAARNHGDPRGGTIHADRTTSPARHCAAPVTLGEWNSGSSTPLAAAWPVKSREQPSSRYACSGPRSSCQRGPTGPATVPQNSSLVGGSRSVTAVTNAACCCKVSCARPAPSPWRSGGLPRIRPRNGGSMPRPLSSAAHWPPYRCAATGPSPGPSSNRSGLTQLNANR